MHSLCICSLSCILCLPQSISIIFGQQKDPQPQLTKHRIESSAPPHRFLPPAASLLQTREKASSSAKRRCGTKSEAAPLSVLVRSLQLDSLLSDPSLFLSRVQTHSQPKRSSLDGRPVGPLLDVWEGLGREAAARKANFPTSERTCGRGWRSRLDHRQTYPPPAHTG